MINIRQKSLRKEFLPLFKCLDGKKEDEFLLTMGLFQYAAVGELNTGQYIFLYYIAALLFAYCIFSSFYNIKSSLLFKIRRYYYSLWILLYAILVNSLNYDVFSDKEILGLPLAVGLPLGIFLAGTIAAVLIDTFIVSATGFKEFSFLGAKFIKAEALETIEIQTKYVQLLSKKIEAEHSSLQQLKIFMDKRQIDRQISSGIDFSKEYANYLRDYLDYQQMLLLDADIDIDIDVDVWGISEQTLNGIKNRYNLSSLDFKKLEANIQNDLPTLLEKNAHYLFVPYVSVNEYHDALLIVFKAKNNLVIEESFIILNLLKAFEEYIYNQIKINSLPISDS